MLFLAGFLAGMVVAAVVIVGFAFWSTNTGPYGHRQDPWP